MKKLLYCNQSMGMGGAEVFVADLLVELQQKEWQVLVVTTRAEFATYLKGHTLAVKKVPFIMDVIGDWKGFVKAFVFGPLSFFQWLMILVLNVANAKQTIVLLSGFNEKLLVTGIAKLLGFKVVWIQFSALGSILDMWGGLVGKCFRQVASTVNGVITSSEFSIKMITAETPSLTKKITVIPCGRKLATSEKFQSNDSKKIVCISRLQPGKGQDLLIQALPIVLKKYPEVQLQIVGEGDFESVLRKMAQELQIEKKVTFLGRVTDISQVLQKAEVSIFPSVWKLEGFGLVLIEAMAFAKPIVTFDRPPLNEIIQNNVNGLLAEVGSVEDLAKKILLLLADPVQRKKLGTQAAEDFQARYTIQKVAEEYDKNLTHYYR